jgi:hypothetical protein
MVISMEKVENIAKYQPKVSKYKSIQLVLKKYIFLVPLLAIMGGVIVAAKIASATGVFQPDWNVLEIEDMVSKDKKDKKVNTKLEAIQEKIKKKPQQDPDGTVVPGSAVVAVDFGKPVISVARPRPEQVVTTAQESPAADTTALPAGIDTVRNANSNDKVAGTVSTSETSAAPSVQAVSTPRPVANRASSPKQSVVKKTRAPVPSPTDTAVTLPPAEPVSAFNMIRSKTNEKKYVPSYINGNQDLVTGAFVKLRLGEDTEINGRTFPRNTVFNGIVKMNKNVINISINRIGTESVSYEVFDRDYSPGIVMSVSKNRDIEQTLNEGLYSGVNESNRMLPIQALQTVTRAVVGRKRQKDSIISINDGYLVYISKETQK